METKTPEKALEDILKWAKAAGFGNTPRSKQWSLFESARQSLNNTQ